MVKLINSLGWTITLLGFFLIVLATIVIREIHMHQYMSRSVPYEVKVDLFDDLGQNEINAIEENLAHKTKQPVSRRIVDNRKKIYIVNVMCPPDDASSILQWLKSRTWVESANYLE